MRLALVMLSDGASHQRYVGHLASELSDLYDIEVVTNEFVRGKLFTGNFGHHRVSAPRTPKIEPATLHIVNLLRAARLLRTLAPDIIHFTCPHPWNMVLPLLGPDAKRVFTIHDVEPHAGESPAWATSIRIYNWVVSRLADRIVLHGEKHMTTVAEWHVPTNRFVVAPLGEFPAPPKPLPPSSSDAILFFGRIRPYKGLGVLAEAAKQLYERGHDFRLVVVGAGDIEPYRDSLESVEAQIHNRFIEPGELSEFFSHCRFVVLPYLSATQSGVIPQAYAYRRPVVATKVGALPEMVEDGKTGYLVPPNSPRDLAEAIRAGFRNPQVADEMGAAAFRLFQSRYTPNAMAENLSSLYLELLSLND